MTRRAEWRPGLRSSSASNPGRCGQQPPPSVSTAWPPAGAHAWSRCRELTGPPGTLGRSHRKSVGQGNTGEVPAESGPWDECVPYLVDLHADKRATYTAAAGEYSAFGAACGFGETIICSRREPTTASCRCRADNGNHYSGPVSMSHQWWRTTLSGKAAAYRTAIIISRSDWRNTAPSPRPQNADAARTPGCALAQP